MQTHAPLELKKATDSLIRANQLQDKGEPVDEIRSAAYVANQQAKTAMAIAKAKGNDAAIAGAEADRQRARADMLAGQAKRAQAQTTRAAQAAGSSGARRAAASAEARTLSAQAGAADARQQAEQLQQHLAALQATQTERGMLVTLGDVLFEFNRAEVKPAAQSSLAKLADFLQQNPSRSVLIEGHTDSIGSAASNEALSRRRADAVDIALEGHGPGRETRDHGRLRRGLPGGRQHHRRPTARSTAASRSTSPRTTSRSSSDAESAIHAPRGGGSNTTRSHEDLFNLTGAPP